MAPSSPASSSREAALTFVNRVREGRHLPPLRELRQGKRHSASQCPIARSVVDDPRRPVTVGSNALVIQRSIYEEEVSFFDERVSAFINEFDDGHHRGLTLRCDLG